jgi:SAM-dependent methyltransferase
MTAIANWEGAIAWLLAQPEQTALVRDCYYDRPAIAAAARYAASEEWVAVRALLPEPAGVALDLGAGHGISSYALARAGWQVTAAEPDPSELVGAAAIAALARDAALPIEVVRTAGERLPFADRSFDLVFARQVLHHARHLVELCREAHRVLRPGGTLLAIREHVISRAADLPRFLEQHPLHRLYGGEHAYRLAEYRTALDAAGFVVTRVLGSLDSPINYAPYTRAGLRAEIVRRAARVPGAGWLLGWALATPGLERIALSLLTRLDGRPGRLYSFVCRRRRGDA